MQGRGCVELNLLDRRRHRALRIRLRGPAIEMNGMQPLYLPHQDSVHCFFWSRRGETLNHARSCLKGFIQSIDIGTPCLS